MTDTPKICVVIPAYNHEKYIAQAIRSVVTQDIPGLELRILDDGSSDATLDVAEQTLAELKSIESSIDTQENRGSAHTINTLIDSADADYVAILNSDDFYKPGRLRSLLQAAENRDLFFGFTGVEFHGSAKVSDYLLFEDWYRSKYAFSCAMPTCGFALLASNITISSGNFFLSREIFDLAGGFDPNLTLTQDWQFAIKTIRWAEPCLVPNRTLVYRVHDDNTYRKLHDIRIDQSKQALNAFVDWVDERAVNPMAPTPAVWPKFFQFFSRTCAPAFCTDPIGTYFPDSMMNPGDNAESIGSEAENVAIKTLLSVSREIQSGNLLSTEHYLERAAEAWCSDLG